MLDRTDIKDNRAAKGTTTPWWPTPGVIVHNDSTSYSPIGLNSVNRVVWAVKVEYTGSRDEQDPARCWAVRNLSRCLNDQEEWDHEPSPSSRSDEWLKTHRFTRDKAEELAIKVCHTVTWNGKTADDVARLDSIE